MMKDLEKNSDKYVAGVGDFVCINFKQGILIKFFRVVMLSAISFRTKAFLIAV